MTTHRTLFAAMAGTCALLVACGGSGDGGSAADAQTTPSTTAATTSSTAAPTTAVPSTSETELSVADTSEPPTPIEAPDDWAEQLIESFDTYVEARGALDDEVSESMSTVETEQDSLDVLANQFGGWAAAGDALSVSMPVAVAAEAEAPLRETMETHTALVAHLRVAAQGLLEGDSEPYAQTADLLDSFNYACAELQFVLLGLGAGDLRCGIAGEESDVRSFVDGPTVDTTDGLVALPAGDYELDYVGIAPTNPSLIVGLKFDDDLGIRTSVEVVELVAWEQGPSIRLHANELLADPTDLASDRIQNFWLNSDGPGGWIGALEGVVVTSTGTGEIAGFTADYWDVVSELDAPVAVLGDGDDWVPETTLDPGQPVRVWSIVIDGHPLVLTEHVPPGAQLVDFESELDLLRSGLTLTID